MDSGLHEPMKKTNENTPAPHGGSLLKKPQVAKDLNVCQRTVDNLMRAKALAFVRIGRAIRFEPSAVEAYKNSYRVNAS
jgi:excisionase family DNA binding protein